MSDFIREVNEDYRRDRVVGFFVKNQVRLIAVAVALLVGIAGYRIYLHYHDQAAELASTRYEAAVQMAREGKSAEAQAAFDKLQTDAPAGYANLARLQAVEALATRDPAAAARGYEAMGADGSIDPSLRDVAQVRAALLRVDSDDPAAFEKRYAPLAAPAFTFHSTIRELLAMAAFKRNDYEAASRWLDQIIIDQQAPAALRSRAEAFLSLVAAGPTQIAAPEPPKPASPPAASTGSDTPSAPTSSSAPAPIGAPLQIVPPTPDAAATEPAKSEAAKSEATKSEAAKSEATKSEAAKSEATKSEAAKSEATKAETTAPPTAAPSSPPPPSPNPAGAQPAH